MAELITNRKPRPGRAWHQLLALGTLVALGAAAPARAAVFLVPQSLSFGLGNAGTGQTSAMRLTGSQYVDFGANPVIATLVGSTFPTQQLDFNFLSSAPTVAKVEVVNQGVPIISGIDQYLTSGAFQVANIQPVKTTWTYPDSLAVTVAFMPNFPGVYTGELLLEDDSTPSKVVACVPLVGTAQAPLDIFSVVADPTAQPLPHNASAVGPSQAVTDLYGNVFVADSGGAGILVVPAGGSPYWLNPGVSVGGLALDSAGDLFYSSLDQDSVRVYPNRGALPAPNAASLPVNLEDSLGQPILLNQPMGLAVDLANDLFIVDSGNEVVRCVGPTAGDSAWTGVQLTDFLNQAVPGQYTPGPLGAIAVDLAGRPYVSDSRNGLLAGMLDGSLSTVAPPTGGPALTGIQALAADPAGNIHCLVQNGAQSASVQTLITANLPDQTTWFALPFLSGPFQDNLQPAALTVDPTGTFTLVGVDEQRLLKFQGQTPGTLTFPGTYQGQSSAASLTFYNLGTGNEVSLALPETSASGQITYVDLGLALGALFWGDNSGDFAFDAATLKALSYALDPPSGPAPIAPGSSATLGFTFSPSETVSSPTVVTGSLQLVDNTPLDAYPPAPGGVFQLNLSGTVLPAPAPTVTTSPGYQNPVLAGTAATFAYSVAVPSGSQPLSGVLTFSFNAINPATGASASVATVNATATGTTSFSGTVTAPGNLPAGNYQVSAVYAADSAYPATASGSGPMSLQITLKPAVTVAPAYQNPVVVGTAATFTYSVTVPAGGQALSGTLAFGFYAIDPATGANSLAATVNAPSAPTGATSFSGSVTAPATLPAGNYLVSATYSGDSLYLNGSSGTLGLRLTLTPTVTLVPGASNPVQAGTAVPFTVTVMVPANGLALSGTVGFRVYAVNPSTGALALVTTQNANASGSTTFSSTLTAPSTLPAGIYQVDAIYAGDALYSNAQASPVSLKVTLTPTASLPGPGSQTVVVGRAPAAMRYQLSVPANGPALSGQIVFTFSSAGYTTTQSVNLAGAGLHAATGTVTAPRHLPAGIYQVSVVYAGDPIYQNALLGTLKLVLTLTPRGSAGPSMQTVQAGKSAWFEYRVSVPGADPALTGSVVFTVGTAPAAPTTSVSLAGKDLTRVSGTLAAPADLPPGIYRVKAEYSGDALYEAAHLGDLLLVVWPANGPR